MEGREGGEGRGGARLPERKERKLCAQRWSRMLRRRAAGGARPATRGGRTGRVGPSACLLGLVGAGRCAGGGGCAADSPERLKAIRM